MLDVRLLRSDLDGVKASLGRRHIDLGDVDRAADLDEQVRKLSRQRDDLRSQIKNLSKEVGAARRDGNADKAEQIAAVSRSLGDEEQGLGVNAEEVERELHDLLLVIPNIPVATAPDGTGEQDNIVLRTEGFDADSYQQHQRVPHWETGAALGILDLERGAKMSGSMFPLFRGNGAALARALCQMALDHNVDLYEEMRPPTLVRTETITATGHLPKFADDLYAVERDGLWGIPTAEVPITSLARDEILDEASLPMRFVSCTPCLRREAGSAGRDTRGLLRVHEFDKVELLAYCTQAQAMREHARIVERAEWMLQQLELPYRVLEICTGDMGQSHAYSVDLEAYAPGVDKWLEVSSISWYSDYQARRANIRYKPSAGGTNVIVHTVNGSGLAVPRVWAALVETQRQRDGSIRLPEPLRPYMRGLSAIS